MNIDLSARRRGHAYRLLAGVATAGALAAAMTIAPMASSRASASTGSQTEVSRGVAIPAFYNPPTTLPSQNGALVRTEPLPLSASLALPLAGTLPGTATRLMYKTTDSSGNPAAVTGAYIEPSADWSGAGPRPLVVVAPGTMGQGDQCAPSMALQNPIIVNGQTTSVGYEDLGVYRLLSEGIAVVVTDYIGLGTTDRLHTYVNRVDEGHAVLDAARAAVQVPGASVTKRSRVGLYGYSQGGGATASAAELRNRYAPDVRLVGSYVGAPPANLIATAAGIDGSALAGALGWTLNGLLQSYPSIAPIVDKYINAAGRTALANLATECTGDAISDYGFQKSSGWTTDGQTLSQIVAREPAIRAVLDKQDLGTIKPYAPVRVATGVNDDIVPHAQARQLAVDWCARGANVTYVPVMVPNLGDGTLINHVTPLLADQTNAIQWLTERVKGVATGSNCALVSTMP